MKMRLEEPKTPELEHLLGFDMDDDFEIPYPEYKESLSDQLVMILVVIVAFLMSPLLLIISIGDKMRDWSNENPITSIIIHVLSLVVLLSMGTWGISHTIQEAYGG